mmetsp:Transcript_11476/g.23407  ORF Transcript_11476/g.23407 Transcript_11476/m.23407 type:complete len:280 (-) Transcript_11476:200-1039(-)
MPIPLGYAALLLLLLFGLQPSAARGGRKKQPYVAPAWWDRLAAEDTTAMLKKCKPYVRRDMIPQTGQRCGREEKLCYFGTQTCPGVGVHPVTQCWCVEEEEEEEDASRNVVGAHGRKKYQWECQPTACPGCASDEDCFDTETERMTQCFSPADDFCGICFTFPPSCTSDEECANGLEGGGPICDDRDIACHCSDGTTCNEPCSSNADCAVGDTCLDGGRCVPTVCTVDTDCVDHFLCSTDSRTCQRRTCTDDEHCSVDAGYCVKGLCFAGRGFCSAPPP